MSEGIASEQLAVSPEGKAAAARIWTAISAELATDPGLIKEIRGAVAYQVGVLIALFSPEAWVDERCRQAESNVRDGVAATLQRLKGAKQ